MKVGVAGPASLHVLEPFVKGKQRLPKGYEFPQTAYLVSQLIRSGHDVTLFTLDRGVETPQVWRGDNLTIHVGRYRAQHRARDFFALERSDLANAMRGSECELIHAHWTYEFAIAALASGRPSLVTVHDWAPAVLRMMPDPYRFMRLVMSWYTFLRGRHFTVISPYIQRMVFRATGTKHPIIPNGLLDELFFGGARTLQEHRPTLISINNGFGKRKNVQRLLEAFLAIRRAHASAELWLVGNGFGANDVAERWSRQRGLANGVRFLGPVEHREALELIRRADALVHPSLEESFGMTLIEALSQGTPVVAGTRSGAVPWVLGNGRYGILTDITKPEAIAEAALRVLDDATSWEHLSEAGRRHAYGRFRLSRVAASYVSEYERVIASATGGH